MKRIFHTGTILIAGISVLACSKNEDATSLPSQSSNGEVRGKITDASGHALSHAKITIEHTVWYDSYVEAVSNNNGDFSATLPSQPAGSWTAKAQIERSAYGKTYKFDLAPSSTDPFDRSKSVTRNFIWKLSGERPGGTYYGAHIDLYAFGTSAEIDKVKLILTPIDNTLIDGSTAIAIERNVEDVAGTFMVKDIPIGRYSVKAVYAGRNLLLENRHDDSGPSITKEVVFGKNGNLAETEYNIEFWVSE